MKFRNWREERKAAKQKYHETECDQYVQDRTGKVWKIAGRLGLQRKYNPEEPDAQDTIVLEDADGNWIYTSPDNDNFKSV